MTPPSKAAAGAHVAKKLRELDVALVASIPRVTENTDAEAIHDLRVCIRRLRTMLAISRPLMGRWHTDHVRRAFADVQRATGELRDEETLEETLEHVSDAAPFRAWLRARSAREGRLRRAVVTRIEHGDLDRARLLLKALLVFPTRPSRDTDLAKFARRAVERSRRRVEKKRDAKPDDAPALHDLRIAYKELRYSIELLAEALPLDARAMLEPATIFQKRLGEIHDVDVALDVIRHARHLPTATRDEVLEGLARLREKRVAKYLKEVDPLLSNPAATTATAASIETVEN